LNTEKLGHQRFDDGKMGIMWSFGKFKLRGFKAFLNEMKNWGKSFIPYKF
jgi:hypothetical protein